PESLPGESAGAINVAYLAAHRGPLPEAVEDLAGLWSQLTPHQVFRVGAPALARNALRWGTRLLSGGVAIAPRVHGLLDTAPLRLLLERSLPTANGELLGIADKLEPGLPHALALTTLARDSPRSETDPRRLDPLSAHPRGGRPAGHSRLSVARPCRRDPPGRDLPRPHGLRCAGARAPQQVAREAAAGGVG